MPKPWRKAEDFWSTFFLEADGRRQPGSGNQPGLPGDVRFLEHVKFVYNHPTLLESKFTEKESISLHASWLDKIWLEAVQLGRMPLLGITLGSRRWLAVPVQAVEVGRN